MCGIVGFAHTGTQPLATSQAEDALGAMCRAMVHRGPDDQGVFVEPPGVRARRSAHTVGLGMRRLSIIDTHGGQQPIFNEDKSVVVVFNGEIYNHEELRSRLRGRGHRFETQSDTEVLVHLYEEKGAKLVEDLVGMFAFAIYDRRREKIVLARDRVGIKPLFVLHKNNALMFASEIKSIVAGTTAWPQGWSPEMNHDALGALLVHTYIPSPGTIYRDVARLDPGSHLTFDLHTGDCHNERYWFLPQTHSPAPMGSYEEASESLDSLLRTCVRDHLVSDVPVGAFVSGGVDSSLVASYAAESYERQLQTFSIGFSESRYDETNDAMFVVRHLQTPHTVQYASYEALLDTLPTIFRAMDEPFADSSMLPTFLVSQIASSRLKVILSGDGGDEVFAGYQHHTLEYLRTRIPSIPQPALTRALDVLERLPKGREGRTTNLFRRAEKAARGLAQDPAESCFEMLKFSSEALAGSVLANPVDFEPNRARLLGIWGPAQRATDLQRTQHTELSISLVDDMLTKVDRMSMLNSLEVRVPLLDHRLIEFGYHLPDAYKLQGLNGKRILKDLFCKRFKLDRYNKAKHGFGILVERWFETQLAPLIRYLFAPDRVRRQGIFAPHLLGGNAAFELAKTSPFLFWTILMAQVWYELQIEKNEDLFNYL